MMLKFKFSVCLLLATCLVANAQINNYSYKRDLRGITGQWHKIILPDDIFGKISPDLTDIRIIGVTAGNDTVVAPYLIRLSSGTEIRDKIKFKLINVSSGGQGYYYTFEVPAVEPVNEITLYFKQENFDWLVTLEGSHDQNTWYTITENYRILSISNDNINFQFTNLTFPDSKYRFLRLFVNSREKPQLTEAKIALYNKSEETYRNHDIKKIRFNENKESKETEIDIDLHLPVPVSYLKISVSDTFDYYRPVSIQYLTDSINTEKGSHLIYSTLTSGILNSVEKNEFHFNSIIARRFKIIISNNDNQPLNIDSVQVKGYIHELIARFTKQADYYLIYGNKSASGPEYDLKQFKNKIPATISAIETGVEQKIQKTEIGINGPLFKNKIWLWIIMVLIIVVLGWFSLKMIQKK